MASCLLVITVMMIEAVSSLKTAVSNCQATYWMHLASIHCTLSVDSAIQVEHDSLNIIEHIMCND
jgi:hypothetical protein